MPALCIFFNMFLFAQVRLMSYHYANRLNLTLNSKPVLFILGLNFFSPHIFKKMTILVPSFSFFSLTRLFTY